MPHALDHTALPSADPQRAAARLELRGGVEDYIAAAERVLSPDGVAVVCADGRRPERVIDGAAAVGLVPHRRRDIFARASAQGPLFSVWTLRRQPVAELEQLRLTVRDGDGQTTKEAQAMRHTFGMRG